MIEKILQIQTKAQKIGDFLYISFRGYLFCCSNYHSADKTDLLLTKANEMKLTNRINVSLYNLPHKEIYFDGTILCVGHVSGIRGMSKGYQCHTDRQIFSLINETSFQMPLSADCLTSYFVMLCGSVCLRRRGMVFFILLDPV